MAPKISLAQQITMDVEQQIAKQVKNLPLSALGGDLNISSAAAVNEIFKLSEFQVRIDDKPWTDPGSTTLSVQLVGRVKDFTDYARDKGLKEWRPAQEGIWHLSVIGQINPSALKLHVEKRLAELETAIAGFNSEFSEMHSRLLKFAAGLLKKRLEEEDVAQKTAAALSSIGYKPRST